jgi:hypothetical protein
VVMRVMRKPEPNQNSIGPDDPNLNRISYHTWLYGFAFLKNSTMSRFVRTSKYRQVSTSRVQDIWSLTPLQTCLWPTGQEGTRFRERKSDKQRLGHQHCICIRGERLQFNLELLFLTDKLEALSQCQLELIRRRRICHPASSISFPSHLGVSS